MAPSLPLTALSKLGTVSRDSETSSSRSSYDYIIVGGGTAGCVLASRLSLLAGKPKVLLLERGDVQHGWVSSVPLLSTAWQSDPAKAFSLRTVPQTGLGGRQCDLVGAKLLGGTSRINSSLYTRGSPSEYDQWATDFDLPSWSVDSVLPHFKESQSHCPLPTLLSSPAPSSVVGPSTGTAGPLKTSTPLKINHATVAPFIASAQKLGVPLVSSLNDPEASANAVAMHEVTGEQGRRRSVLDFLIGDKGGFGEGLQIGVGALVHELEIDADGRCVGVWFSEEKDSGSPLLFASCSKEVIVTAGALHSPQLLLLSGIGPKDELASHGVDCKVDLPGVGKGLADHLGVYIPYSVPYTDSLDRIETSPLHAMSQLFSFFTSRSGAFTFQGAQACIMTSSSRVDEMLSPTSPYSTETPLVTSSRDLREIPDLELIPLPIRYHSSLEDGKPDGKTSDLRKGKYDKTRGYLTPIIVLVKPKSTGNVVLSSSNPRDQLVYDPQFLSDPADVAILVKGMRFCKKLLRQMKDSGYDVEPHGPNYPFHDKAGSEDRDETDEELEAYARKWANPAYHSSSTLRVSSKSDPLGVCDEQLRVRGVTGLRVADASVFPTVVAAHTQAAVVMVAEKCSALIAEEWKGSQVKAA